MAYDTFVPAFKPSPKGTLSDVKARITTNKFGGWKQDQPNGTLILTGDQTVTLAWPLLPLAAADAIQDFMERHAKTAFIYTVPNEGTARKWRWTQYLRNYVMPAYDSITITVEERALL
jgi:phage-related protein